MISSNQMPRSVSGAPRIARMVVVILAIAVMLCVSAVSVSSSHVHLNSPTDRCDICATAHMPVQQVAFIRVVHTLELQSFLPPPAASEHVDSPRILALLTRGPPSSL
jgi:hypothetical protein